MTATVLSPSWIAPRKAMIRAITVGNVTWLTASGLAFALWPAVPVATSAGKESRRWKVNQRVLQNTIEQAFIFLPALVALALRVEARHLAVVPIAVALWCAGRVLFWVGYHKSPVWRAPGFDWTINTTFLVMARLAVTMF
jgi:hypothetical protein